MSPEDADDAADESTTGLGHAGHVGHPGRPGQAERPGHPDRPAPPVTIYDVAARAGVSIATVSHALNRPERVAARTRERVLGTAQELGFAPRGRGPAARRLRRVLVAAPLSARPSTVPRLLGALAAASRIGAENGAGIEVIPRDISAPPAADPQEPVVRALDLPRDLDGLILVGAAPSPELFARLVEAALPTVLVDARHPRLPSVVVDDEAGGALVADHLRASGRRRPVWVSPAPPPSGILTSGERRLRGVTGRWSQGDAPAHPGPHGDRADRGAPMPWVICEDSIEGGYAAVPDILACRTGAGSSGQGDSAAGAGGDAAGAGPDAVIAVHDAVAAGVLRGLREHGMRVPEDLAVIGCDDSDLARALDLTSIRQPLAATGSTALELLRTAAPPRAEPLADPAPVTAPVTVLAPELVVRSSSARRQQP